MGIQAVALSFLRTAGVTSASTLERRFGLTSAQVGMFRSIQRAFNVFFVIPVAHYANKGGYAR